MATKDNVDWPLHIDTDELMYPGGSASFSLQDVLATFPDDVDTVVFPNYESLPESNKVHDPFTEVMLSPNTRQTCPLVCCCHDATTCAVCDSSALQSMCLQAQVLRRLQRDLQGIVAHMSVWDRSL